MIFEHMGPFISVGSLLAGICLFGACTTSRLPQTGTTLEATDSDVASLKQAEDVWVRSLTEANFALLAKLIDPDFTFIGPDGQYEERAAYLEGYRALPSMGVKVESLELQDLKFRVVENTGIVTGRVLARVRMASAELTEDVRFTRVYRRDGAAWRMIAGQGTRLVPVAAADTGR